MRKTLMIAMLLLTCVNVYAQDCPVSGDSNNPKIQAADSLKNRSAMPDRYKMITIDDMLAMTVDNTTSQLNAVEIQGYVLDIKNGGVESCNCHSKTNRDTHIYLVADNTKDASQSVIVEVTPRFRNELGTTAELKAKYLHQHVIVSGYLFKDEEHKQNSTVDNGKGNHWRGTTWEIHPVTNIEKQ